MIKINHIYLKNGYNYTFGSNFRGKLIKTKLIPNDSRCFMVIFLLHQTKNAYQVNYEL